jgi:hypothetical protein
VEEQRKPPPNSAFILPVALEPVDPQTAQVPELFRRIQWLPLYQRNSTIELVELITQRVRERQRGAKAT